MKERSHDCDEAKSCPEQGDSRVIQREISRIDGDISQLLMLYRMETGSLALHVEDVELQAYLTELVLAHRLLFDLHGIEVDIDCAEEARGLFDPRKVKTVLQSVIVAVIKYTRNKLLIRVQKDQDFLRISILDNGIGYPEALLTTQHHQIPQSIESELESESKANLNMYLNSQDFPDVSEGALLVRLPIQLLFSF